MAALNKSIFTVFWEAWCGLAMFSMHTWYNLNLDHHIRDTDYWTAGGRAAAPWSQQLNATSRLQQHALPSCLPALASRTYHATRILHTNLRFKTERQWRAATLTNLLNELLQTVHKLVAVILYLRPVAFRFDSRAVRWSSLSEVHRLPQPVHVKTPV